MLDIGPNDLTALLLIASGMSKAEADEVALKVLDVYPFWNGAAMQEFKTVGRDAFLKGEQKISAVNPSDQLGDAVMSVIGWRLGIAEMVLPKNKGDWERVNSIIAAALQGKELEFLNVAALMGAAKEVELEQPMATPNPKKDASARARAEQAALTARLASQPCMPIVADGRPAAPRHDHVENTKAGRRGTRPQRGGPVAGVGKGAQSRKKQKT